MKEDTLILNKGYDHKLSEGSIVTPIFRSSTFCFETAEEGERSFQLAYKLDTPNVGEIPVLIYSRVNNPNMEIVEERLSVFDKSEKSLLFSSGMGAISNTCMSLLKPGDTVLYSNPVYGGSEFLFKTLLPQYNINCVPFLSGSNLDDCYELSKKYENIKMIFIETPCNPLTTLTSVKEMVKLKNKISDETGNKVVLTVDNTFCGPVYLKPIELGADLVVYSLTKFIGGHSDLVAGSVSGSIDLIDQVRVTRTIFGTIPDPDTCWLIQRSLVTLKLRMEKQCLNAKKIVYYLNSHKNIKQIFYPGLGDEKQNEIFHDEYHDSGSIISFKVNGDKSTAFKILNKFKVFKLAVSLGSVESLIQHPSSMTHSDIPKDEQVTMGITEDLIRCSVGLEDSDDLIEDLKSALDY